MANYQYHPQERLRILELFAGIGGLHWALKLADVSCEVIAAMEINPTVLEIYEHNFKGANVIRKNILGLTAKEINKLNIDAIVMSPPCQPFCRMGNRLDVEDNRTGPLSHITEILEEVNFRYIFVENVQGFEDSTARENLLQVLLKLQFQWQEFMLTPKSVGVPNSRLRYYLIGKHKDLPWTFSLKNDESTVLSEIPNWAAVDENDADEVPLSKLKKKYELEVSSRRNRWKKKNEVTKSEAASQANIPFSVGDIIDWNMTEQELDKLKISPSVLKKYYQAMDIVTPSSTNTCCFTKGYGNYVKGTGSVLKFQDDDDDDPTCIENDKTLSCLRYFSPKEISRLMSFPEKFELPSSLSLKQMHKSLGNSVNVYVVAILFSLLFSEPLINGN